MLDNKTRKKLPWIVLASLFLILLLDFVLWWGSLGHPLHTTVCDPMTSQHYCQSYNPLFGFAVSWAYDLNYWGALVTAIATGFIAWFTFSLRDATKEQGRLTQESINLAQAEFVASHRPKIVVHTIEYTADHVGGAEHVTIGAELTFVNEGDTEAKGIVISGAIFESDGRPPTDLLLPEVARRTVCAPGAPQSVEFVSCHFVMAHELLMQLAARDGKEEYASKLRCIGAIEYFDKNGVRRVTGFCWRLHGKRWVHQTRSGYDYSY